jgi:hypothetical protein
MYKGGERGKHSHVHLVPGLPLFFGVFSSQTQLIHTPHPPTGTESASAFRHHAKSIESLLAGSGASPDVPLLVRTQGVSVAAAAAATPAGAVGAVTAAAGAVVIVVCDWDRRCRC